MKTLTGATYICWAYAQSLALAKSIKDLHSDCVKYAKYTDRVSVNSVYKIGLGKYMFYIYNIERGE